MPALGDLVVRLGAQTNGFDRKMRQSQTLIGRFGGAVGGLSRRMIGLSSLFTGVAGGGMAVMLKRNIDLMDATGKMADRIGMTTEALQGLRYAADLTGAGADTLDAGLTTMAKRLGEAARDAGAAKPALEQLRLPIDELLRLSPDEQFIRIADAIALLPTATERAAAAANIFSKGNMALINTLAEGGDGLRAMQAEAKDLGITFDRGTAAKAEKANDAFTRLGRIIQGTLLDATADLAGNLADVATGLEDVAKSGKGRPTLLDYFTFPLEAASGIVAHRMGYGPDVSAQRYADEEREAYRQTREENRRRRQREAIEGPVREGAAAAFGWLNRFGGGLQGEIGARGKVFAQRGREWHERQQGMRERAGELRQIFETPLERFTRMTNELERLRPLLGEGTYQRAKAGYLEELARSAGGEGPEKKREAQFAGALEKGSREAYSAILAATGGRDQKHHQRELLLANKEQVDILREIRDAEGGDVEIPV